MAKEKKVYHNFTSHPVTFKFPKINKIDFGTEEYPKPFGEFSVRGVCKADDPAFKALIEKLQPLHDQAVADGKIKDKERKAEARKKDPFKVNALFTELLDQETEQPTGEVEMKFGMAASGEAKEKDGTVRRWIARPAAFDANGKPIPLFFMKKGHPKNGTALDSAPEIWGGTVGRIAFEASPYYIKGTGAAGLKLRLNAVKILKLVTKGQRDAAGYGFGDAEEGYAFDGNDGDEPSFADDDATAGGTSNDGASDAADDGNF